MRDVVKAHPAHTTIPRFQSEATALADELAKKSVADIAKLFG